DGAGWTAVLPHTRSRADHLVHRGRAVHHGEPPVARISRRQRGSNGPFRATDRHAGSLSDDRPVGAVRADRVAAAAAARAGASAAAHVCGVVAERNLARRWLGRSRWRRRYPDADVLRADDGVSPGVPMGVVTTICRVTQ